MPFQISKLTSSPFALRVLLFLLFSFGVGLAARQYPYGQDLYRLTYGLGPVIHGLVLNKSTCAINGNYGWCSYATRMPLIPVLGALLFHLSDRAIVLFALKNIVTWSLWAYAVYRLKNRLHIQSRWLLLALAVLLLSPYDLNIASRCEMEEGFLVSLLTLLFVCLLSFETTADDIIAGLVLACIYLTKSSMLLVCIVGLAWALVSYWRSKRKVAWCSAVLLAASILGWGSYIQSVSGVFAIGQNVSSWNGWNFYKGNNEWVNALYPSINLDSLDYTQTTNRLLPFVPVHNEWELQREQFRLGSTFIRTHLNEVLRMEVKKMEVACCKIGESPEEVPGHERFPVELSNLTNHLLTTGVCFLLIFNLFRGTIGKAEILFALFVVAYLTPYLAGFLYGRHMVPIYFLASCTLAAQLSAYDARRTVNAT